MICYRDMTFCGFWRECGAIKETFCQRPLTEAVETNAKRVGLPIAQFSDKPKCFKAKERAP